MRYIALMCMTVAIAMPCYPRAGSSRLAVRLVDLMNYEQQFYEYKQQCIVAGTTIPVDRVLGVTETSEALVRPGTKYWPRVIAAYQSYYDELCSRPTKDEFLAALASAYADQLSDEDLASAIEFHSSTLGRRLVASHQVAAKSVYSEWARVTSANAPAALERFHRQLEAIGHEATEQCRHSEPNAPGTITRGCGKPTQ
jgi:uncharacterized protein DUF2059